MLLTPTLLLICAVLVFGMLAYLGFGYLAWLTAATLALAAWHLAGPADMLFFEQICWVTLGVALLFGLPPLRRLLVTKILIKIASKSVPKIGETEEIALKAGHVWWDGELFSGDPNWRDMLKFDVQPLTKEEKAFLAGPVEKLCAILNDEQIYQDRDLPKKAWDLLKKEKFLGMIIPKEHGGLGFSAAAHAAVVTRIGTVSVPAAVTVMVPNSLGPGELLLHYGTEAQKKHYLPRLAEGKEIPCFALTEPHAGSDAANGRSVGVICKGKWNGKQVIGMKLTFNKRYITLAPIATVVGLAFRLYDPEHLLGDKEDIGITCALLPRDTKGLEIGNRHDPMGVPFHNGPVRGKEVFVPLDYIIGGADYAGKGWRMLMENLATGRGISLPSMAVGAAQYTTRATSAYAQVREQFGLPIGQLEGVRERLAQVFGYTYFMNAVHRLSSGAVDAGISPAVVSGIAKAYLTEGMRTTVNDGMDIHAGSAICRGERNLFARAYYSIPIGITVEGANILTRSMIIFGQGAIRCHPFIQAEADAVQRHDLKAFDKAIFGHMSYALRNATRAFVLAVTGGIFACVPCRERKHYRRLTRYAAAFALLADLALLTLGGAMKRKESISGRFSDALAWLYIATATLKHYHDAGRPKEQKPLLDWTMTTALYEIEQALLGILRNLPNRPIACIGRVLTFPFGGCRQRPTDAQLEAVVKAVLDPATGLRDTLTNHVFVPAAEHEGLGRLEDALVKVLAAQPARAKVQRARRKGIIAKAAPAVMAEAAKKAKVITDKEYKQILAADAAQDDAVQVNDFTPKEYLKRH